MYELVETAYVLLLLVSTNRAQQVLVEGFVWRVRYKWLKGMKPN